MPEIFLYSVCVISLMLSIASLYVSLSLAKSVKVAHQNLQVLFQVLTQPPQASYSYDEYGEYGEEINNYPIPNSKVVDLFSRQALEWSEVLNEWVPKPED